MAVVTPVASNATYLEGLEKSGLVPAAALADARAMAAKAADPKVLARDLIKSGTLTKWQANQLLHGFHQLTIGKFKLLDQVGVGEIGRVYLAEHAQIGRRHTLKVLAKRHMSNPDVVRKFLAEAATACGLDHRNISHVYDVSQDGDRCFVVMEYVEGENLQQHVERSGKLPLPQALALIQQTADGLAHAHENSVVHGDLKPTNLLLEASGTLKILDIGQAGLLAGPIAVTADESQEAATVAASLFRAPERRAAQPAPADVRGDIYSLGSVLCFLLTGKPAVDAAEAAKALSAADAPAEVVEVCSRMMADATEQRQASMSEVLSELAVLTRVKPVPSKSKKPPVAKAPVVKSLSESASLPVARALDDDESEPSAVQSGPAVKTKGKKPPVKAVALPAAASKGKPTPAEAAVGSGASKAPLLIAAAIGSGVLVLAGIGVAVALYAFGGNSRQVALAPPPVAPAVKAPTGEANPAESNPPAPVEANPTVEVPQPAPAPQATTTKAPEAPQPEPMPAATEKSTPEPPPEVKPPPPKAKTPPAKTTPKATEPKAKPKAEPLPFAGFAKSVTLPPLTDAMGQRMAEALAPLTLGPCKVAADATIATQLKGGETAIRGGKQKFELRPTGGAPPRDWEFLLAGGEAPIATLAAKDGQLAFQWTEEGVKQAAQAKLLCNCAIELTAGAGKHQVALRQPASGAPLVVDFEKSSNVKWTIESLPDLKSIRVEATRFDGLPRQKVEPANATALNEDLVVWTGPVENAMYLSLKLTPAAQGRGIQIASAPQAKLPGMAKPVRFSKKDAANTRQAADAQLAALTGQLNVLSKQKSRAGDATDVLKNQTKAQLDETTKGVAVLEQILTFVTATQGVSKIQFRVYHEADDAQIDLLLTADDAK